MNIFYYFMSKLVNSYFYAYMCELDQITQLVQGDYKGVSFPIIFKQAGGKKITDIIETGTVSLYLISDRMKIILEENKLTGWQVFPIKLFDKNSKEIVGYHGFSVIGRCSFLSYKNSKIIEKRHVPTGPICKYYKGAFVENWDGSDFFCPEKTTKILISERTASILKKNKISNFELINLLDYEIDVDDLKILEKRN